MIYLLYAIPVIAFGIVLCVLAAMPGTTRDELNEAALLQDIKRRCGNGKV